MLCLFIFDSPLIYSEPLPIEKISSHILENLDSDIRQEVIDVITSDGVELRRKYTPRDPIPLEMVGEDADYDTDLETEFQRKSKFNMSNSEMYVEVCKQLNIIPSSFALRHMGKDRMMMPHHGLGPIGAKALSVPLVSNTTLLHLNLEDNWLRSKGANYIAEMMKENCYILSLNISENRIGDGGAESLCTMMGVSATRREY